MKWFLPRKTVMRRDNVPVPNLGWFCSQACATEFEKKHHVTFTRNEEGKVDYYSG